jgi:hypothetical protein
MFTCVMPFTCCSTSMVRVHGETAGHRCDVHAKVCGWLEVTWCCPRGFRTDAGRTDAGRTERRVTLRARMMAFLARRFGWVFVLALIEQLLRRSLATLGRRHAAGDAGRRAGPRRGSSRAGCARAAPHVRHAAGCRSMNLYQSSKNHQLLRTADQPERLSEFGATASRISHGEAARGVHLLLQVELSPVDSNECRCRVQRVKLLRRQFPHRGRRLGQSPNGSRTSHGSGGQTAPPDHRPYEAMARRLPRPRFADEARPSTETPLIATISDACVRNRNPVTAGGLEQRHARRIARARCPRPPAELPIPGTERARATVASHYRPTREPACCFPGFRPR